MLLATQDGQNEYERDKRPGLLVPHFASCYATPRRSRPKPRQPVVRSALRQHVAILPASRSASNSTAPHAASPSLGTAAAPCLGGLSTSSELCPRAYILESSPHDKRPGLLVLPSASCHATLRRSRPKPHEPDLFAPRYASMLQFCQPRALHFTSTALRAASVSLGTASLHLFLVLPTSSELCPRAGKLESRPWIISDQESPFCRFAEGSIGPRANLGKAPGRSSRDILWTTGAGPR